MKKILLFTFVFISFVFFAEAQFIQIGNSLISNTRYGPMYRTGATSTLNYCNYAYLYTSNELSQIPPGARITRIEWQARNNSGGLSGSNLLRIYMQETNQSQINIQGNTFLNESAGVPIVYEETNYGFPAGGGWIGATLDNPIVYRGDNLKILVEHAKNGTATGAFNWYAESQPGKCGGTISSITPINGFQFSTFYSDSRPNIRIHYLLPLPDDVGISSIDQPSAFCVGTAPVIVSLENFGRTQIDTVTIEWEINGTAQTPVQWAVTLDTIGGFGLSKMPVFLGTRQFNAGVVYDIKAWTVLPNGNLDPRSTNDTTRVNAQSSLSGSFTISTRDPNADYIDIRDAINDLQAVGVCGDVEFLVDSGEYRGPYELSNIDGSQFFKITFQSLTRNKNDVVITNTTNGTPFKITGTSNVILANLTFRKNNPPSGVEYTLEISGGAVNTVVVNCVFDNRSTSTSSFNRNLAILDATNTSIIQNEITGGYYGVYLEGSLGNHKLFNRVVQNSIHDCRFYGIYAQYQSFGLINTNEVKDINGVSTSSGIYTRFSDNMTIAKNSITGEMGTYGLRLEEMMGDANAPNRVYNNSIGAKFTNTSSFSVPTPIYVQGREDTTTTPRNPKDYVELIHNSVNAEINNSGSAQEGIISVDDFTFRGICGFSGLVIYNNSLLAYPTPGRNMPNNMTCLYINDNCVRSNMTLDNNNYYMVDQMGSRIDRIARVQGVISSTLLAWQTSTGQDINSISDNPIYSSASLLIPNNSLLDSAGRATYVEDDIFGNARDTLFPDIGAHEYELRQFDIGVIGFDAPLSGCGLTANEDVTVKVYNAGQQALSNIPISYSINGGAPVNEIITATVNPDDTLIYTFTTKANVSARGSYIFVVSTSLASDQNAFNDQINQEVVNPTIKTFPHLETFETGVPGTVGNTRFPDGWTTNNPNNSFVFTWLLDQGTTPNGSTGPNVDHTLGTNQGIYAFTEASFTGTGVAELYSPCIEIIPGSQVGVSFWYHMYGSQTGEIFVEIDDGTGVWATLDHIQGQQQTSSGAAWRKRTVSLAGYSGSLTVRFRAVKGAGTLGDMAIDDIEFSALPPLDVQVLGFTEPPVRGCGLSNAENVTMRLKNSGTQTIRNFIVSYTLNGLPAFQLMTDSIPSGDTLDFTFTTTADMSMPGNFTLDGLAFLVGDSNNSNDSIFGYRSTHVPTINTFPYSEDFESGDGGWAAGGDNSTWVLGNPLKSTIRNAASGTNAWVTGRTGFHNNSERSFVESPCYDFSTLQSVRFKAAVWWDTWDSQDGTVLEYSLDDGDTWIRAGALNDPDATNWYNSNTMSDASVRAYFDNNQNWWSGRLGTGSGQWINAEIVLDTLAGQSKVKFRFNFASNAFTQDDGFAFDDILIDEPIEPVVVSVTKAGDSCSVQTKLIEAVIAASFAPVQIVNLNYDLTSSGTYTAIPMTYNMAADNWRATIPVSMPATMVSYYVSVVDTANLTDTSDVCTYTDEYLQVDAGMNRTIPAGASVTLKATGTGGSGGASASPIKITEMDLGAPDELEIMNVSNRPINVNGWKVAISGNYSTINTVNANVQTLTGTMQPGEIKVWNDNSGSPDYWGSNMLWNPGSYPTFTGWAIIIDNQNNVVDFLPTNWLDADIQGANLNISGANISIGSEWVGDGVDGTSTSNTITVQRQGSDDNNNRSDFMLLPDSYNMANTGLATPFSGSGGATYTWSNGTSTISTTDSAVVTPGVTTTYYVTLSDSTCSVTDSVTVTVSGMLQPDAGATRINAPLPGAIITSPAPQTVRTTIKNLGLLDISPPVNLSYEVNGTVIANETYNGGSILVGDSIQYTFLQQWTPNMNGQNQICVYTTLTNDVDVTNDTTCISLSVAIGIDEIETDQFINRIYPNPAQDYVVFEFGENIQRGNLQLYDKLGKLVGEWVITPQDISSKQMKVELKNLAEGIYNYKITSQDKYQSGNIVIHK